jgi:hypothetical protein
MTILEEKDKNTLCKHIYIFLSWDKEVNLLFRRSKEMKILHDIFLMSNKSLKKISLPFSSNQGILFFIQITKI